MYQRISSFPIGMNLFDKFSDLRFCERLLKITMLYDRWVAVSIQKNHGNNNEERRRYIVPHWWAQIFQIEYWWFVLKRTNVKRTTSKRWFPHIIQISKMQFNLVRKCEEAIRCTSPKWKTWCAHTPSQLQAIASSLPCVSTWSPEDYMWRSPTIMWRLRQMRTLCV